MRPDAPKKGEQITVTATADGNVYRGDDGRVLGGMEGPYSSGVIDICGWLYYKPSARQRREIEQSIEEIPMVNRNFNHVHPGDRISLVPDDGTGPSVTGYVTEATPTYVTIRGLGFTQFQAQQFSVAEAQQATTGETVDPEREAQNALLGLLKSADERIRFQAAQELLTRRF